MTDDGSKYLNLWKNPIIALSYPRLSSFFRFKIQIGQVHVAFGDDVES